MGPEIYSDHCLVVSKIEIRVTAIKVYKDKRKSKTKEVIRMYKLRDKSSTIGETEV